MNNGSKLFEGSDIPVVGESDTVVYLDEIEIEEVKHEAAKAVNTDPFFSTSRSSLPRKFQQRVSRLEKRLEGQDGARSKYVDPELITGYSLFDLVMPPYDLSTLAQLYDENAILHSTVDARVMNTVALGIEWEATTKATRQIERSSGNETRANKTRISHQKEIDMLNDLFDELNEEETLIETCIKVWTDVLTTGNGYMEIGRTIGGKIGYVGHIPSMLVRVRRPRDGFVQQANHTYVFFRNFGDTDTIDPVNGDPLPNEIIHFKLYTPTNSFYGVPPSVSALSAIVGDKFAKEFNIDYFENKAIPRYAIILKGVKLSAQSKNELISYFRNEIKGKNHGTLIVPLPSTIGVQTPADVKFEKLETGIQEGSFDKYRKANRDEIIIAYRTPPTKVGVFDNANLSVSRDADKTFKSQVIGPDQTVLEKKINRIVKEFTDLFVLNFIQFDIIDEDTRSRINDRYLRTQVVTPNEVRQEINKQPISGGDKPLPFPDPNKRGQGFGNKNALSGNPEKSGEDNGKAASDKDSSGTNAERGQLQDEGQGRDRVGRE